MTKSLLLTSLVLMGGISAMALPTAPSSHAGQQICAVSPDGRYAASEVYGAIIITDLDTGHEYAYAYDGTDENTNYSVGLGNCWSTNGILVGSTSYQGLPNYWQNGEWKTLPNPDGRAVWLQGINRDGTVICGTVSTIASDNLPTDYNDVAAVWTLNEDGTWSNPVILPHPTKDYTGRVPQMATALMVANDGKTIAGQLLDYSGQFPMPLIYTQNTEGSWSYDLPGYRTLCNPNGYEFPEFPEDAPVSPDAKDYISDEQMKADYEAAFAAWVSSGYQLPYPEATDYLSAEDIERYNNDVDVYNNAAIEYNDKLEKFNDIFYKMYDESIIMTFNNVLISGDAVTMATTQQYEVVTDPTDPWGGIESYSNPMCINIKSGEFEMAPIENNNIVRVTSMADDGTLLAYSDEANRHAFIKRPGMNWIGLHEYLNSYCDDETKSWLKENVYHTFSAMDYLTGDSFDYVDEPLLGMPFCTPDLKVIATCALNTWDFDDPNDMYSYVIPVANATLGIEHTTMESDFSLHALRGGVIVVDSLADIQVYDMQGRKVFAAQSVSGNINTGLEHGFYTVKATSEGNCKVVKAQL